MQQLSFELRPRPPYRLDLTVWVLRRRAHNAIDRLAAGAYQRVLVCDGAALEVSVAQRGTTRHPVLVVEARGARAVALEAAIERQLRRLLGVDIDLGGFQQAARADRKLAPLAARFCGVRPPQFASLFETLVNAIACQQLTLTLGIRLLNRLTADYGRRAGRGRGAARAFPQPEDLAGVAPEALRAYGFSGQKARAIVTLAEQVAAGAIDLEALRALDDGPAQARLLQLRGIGRWSAEYALLRGLGRLHIFPGDDTGARGGLARWLERDKFPDYDSVARAVRHWYPYAGLVYFHLLLRGLAQAGVIP